jgi:hypothetical protein
LNSMRPGNFWPAPPSERTPLLYHEPILQL